jgi:Trk K+ transport system NAD-binding subunit
VLEEAGIHSMGTFMALTNNGEVNLVLAQRASEEFRPPRILAVFPQPNSQKTNSNNSKIEQAFISQFSIKTWNKYLDDGQIKLGTTLLKEPEFSAQKTRLQTLIDAGELLPLLIKREQKLQVVTTAETWLINDEIIYLLHDPRPKLLKRLAGGKQSNRLVLEQLSEVEEIPIAIASSQG